MDDLKPTRRRTLRTIVLPLGAAATVAAVIVGVTLGVNHHSKPAPRPVATVPPPPSPSGSGLVGVPWLLETFNVPGPLSRAQARVIGSIIGTGPRLTFDGKDVVGTFFCGWFRARVAVNGPQLALGKPRSVMPNCDAVSRTVMRTFLTYFRSVRRWAISAGTLQLTSINAKIDIVFRAQPLTVLTQGHRGSGEYQFLYNHSGLGAWLKWLWQPNGRASQTPEHTTTNSDTPPLQATCARVDHGAGFVYGWATSAATRVVYGGAPELTLYPRATWAGHVAFGGFVDKAHSHMPLTVYDANGKVLARSTSLPCR